MLILSPKVYKDMNITNTTGNGRLLLIEGAFFVLLLLTIILLHFKYSYKNKEE